MPPEQGKEGCRVLWSEPVPGLPTERLAALQHHRLRQFGVQTGPGHEHVGGQSQVCARCQDQGVRKGTAKARFLSDSKDVAADIHDLHDVGFDKLDQFGELTVQTCGPCARVEEVQLCPERCCQPWQQRSIGAAG